MPKEMENDDKMDNKTIADFEEFWDKNFTELKDRDDLKAIGRICWANASYYAVEKCRNMVIEQMVKSDDSE